MQTPKIAFFDLDNTLYSYEIAHEPAQKALIEYLGKQLGMKTGDVATRLEFARDEVKVRLGDIASSHSRLMYVTQFLNDENINSRPSLALSAEQVYWRTFLRYMVLFDGVKDLLTALRLRQCKTVLVTDLSTSIQYRKMLWLGLEGYFDQILTSEEAGGDKRSGKPEEMLKDLIRLPIDGGWCIGDQDFDHLFKESTVFFHRLGHSSGSNKRGFKTFDELIAELDKSIIS